MKDLGHVEVAMRNALDARMVATWERKGWGHEWLDDDDGRLGRSEDGAHSQPYRSISEARERVERSRREVTRDQIISETSFGLWAQLVSNSHKALWPDLASAFPFAPNRDQAAVAGPVGKLRTFRNRVAHHQKLYNKRPEDHHAQLLKLAGFIDPSVKAWILDHSYVGLVMQRKP